MALRKFAGLLCVAWLAPLSLFGQGAATQTTSGPLSRSLGATYIKGHVEDANGQPAGAVEIELHKLGGSLLAVGTTTGGGYFQFRVLAAGPYELHVSAYGTNAVQTVDQDNLTDVLVKLHSTEEKSKDTAAGPATPVSANDAEATQKARDKLRDASKEMDKPNYTKALKLANEAIAAAPKWGQPYFTRGLLEMDAHDYAHAEEDFSTAITDNPNNAAALTVLGKLRATTGQYSSADYYLRRALALPPVMWQTYMELSQLDMLRENYTEAEGLARSAMGAKPAGPLECHLIIAEAAGSLGDWQTAAEHYKAYLAQSHSETSMTTRARQALAASESRLEAEAAVPPTSAGPVAEVVPAVAIISNPLPLDSLPAPGIVRANSAAPAASGAPVADPTLMRPIAAPRTTTLNSEDVAGPSACVNCDSAAASSESKFAFRSTVNEVRVQVTVLDQNRHVVPGLPGPDFAVYENGVKQEVDSFSHEDAPVSVGILVDSSGSMLHTRSAVNRAALNFIAGTNPQDEVFIGNFNDAFQMGAQFTDNVNKLRLGLARVTIEGGTALYDAVLTSLDYINENATRAKRVLVVITDGEDDDSRHTLEQTLSLLHDPNAPIVYCIGISDTMDRISLEAKRALKTIAEATGGMAYFPADASGVDQVTRSLSRTLREQYSLSYKSNQTSAGYRPIRIEVKDPKQQNLTAVARNGYMPQVAAGAAGTAPSSKDN